MLTSISDSSMPITDTSQRRLMLLGACISLLLFGILHADTALFLGTMWWGHQAYGHGLLLIPVGVYMLWARRRQLAQLPWQPSIWGLGFLMGVALAAWLGSISGINLLSQMAFAAAPLGIVWSLFGFTVVRVAIFPLGCMLLVIPVWDVLITPLQEITTVASTQLLRLIGVPVYVEGHYMTIPNGQFAIERVCAGLRYLLAMVSIATLYAYMHLQTPVKAIAFTVAAVLLAVLFNWIRVTSIIVVGYVTDMQSSLVYDHDFFGWVLFVFALFPLLWLGGRLADNNEPYSDTALSGIKAVKGATTSPTFKTAIAITSVLVLILAPTTAPWWLTQDDPHTSSSEFAAIEPTPSWRGPAPAATDWQPNYQGASAFYEATYQHQDDTDRPVDLRLAHFATSGEGGELVSFDHADYRESKWRQLREFKRAVAGGPAVAETLIRAKTGITRRLIWRWFVIGGHATHSPEKAKLLSLWGRLSGDPSGAIIALSTTTNADNFAAMRERLELFVTDMVPTVNQHIAHMTTP